MIKTNVKLTVDIFLFIYFNVDSIQVRSNISQHNLRKSKFMTIASLITFALF